MQTLGLDVTRMRYLTIPPGRLWRCIKTSRSVRDGILPVGSVPTSTFSFGRMWGIFRYSTWGTHLSVRCIVITKKPGSWHQSIGDVCSVAPGQ